MKHRCRARLEFFRNLVSRRAEVARGPRQRVKKGAVSGGNPTCPDPDAASSQRPALRAPSVRFPAPIAQDCSADDKQTASRHQALRRRYPAASPDIQPPRPAGLPGCGKSAFRSGRGSLQHGFGGVGPYVATNRDAANLGVRATSAVSYLCALSVRRLKSRPQSWPPEYFFRSLLRLRLCSRGLGLCPRGSRLCFSRPLAIVSGCGRDGLANPPGAQTDLPPPGLPTATSPGRLSWRRDSPRQPESIRDPPIPTLRSCDGHHRPSTQRPGTTAGSLRH